MGDHSTSSTSALHTGKITGAVWFGITWEIPKDIAKLKKEQYKNRV